MDKDFREFLEYKSIFASERYAKQAWKALIGRSLQSPAQPLPGIYDPKTNELSAQSLLDKQAYDNVLERLRAEGVDRMPTQVECIIECNILRARFDTGILNTFLERTAGKVKDEVQVNTNEYAALSDEELAVLQRFRSAHKDLVPANIEELRLAARNPVAQVPPEDVNV